MDKVIWEDDTTVKIPKKELWKAIVFTFQGMSYNKDPEYKQAIDALFEYIKEEI